MRNSVINDNWFYIFYEFWWNLYYAHKSNDIEIMMGSETDKIIEEIFQSLLQKYQ